MRKRGGRLCAVFTATVLLLSGCTEKRLADGVYTAMSEADDTGAWGEVTLTVAGGKVAGVEFVTRQKDGTPKGEDYGKVNGEVSNQAFYDKAQVAVRAMKRYAARLAETGRLEDVDAVSGATISHGQFLEAAGRALDAAARR